MDSVKMSKDKERSELLICSVVVAKEHHGAKPGGDDMNSEVTNQVYIHCKRQAVLIRINS